MSARFFSCSAIAAIFALSAISVAPVQADQFFEATRIDTMVPRQCADPQLKDFQENSRYFYYGIKGARAAGFTHEYPILREDATYLWNLLQQQSFEKSIVAPKAISNRPELLRDFKILSTFGVQMGFDWDSEGEVLETLALYDLQKTFPLTEYFYTGGITYGDPGYQGVLGELDLVIARRSDCAVVAVGEAKLGLKQLGHARQQMARFHEFMTRKVCRGADKKAVPICNIQNTQGR